MLLYFRLGGFRSFSEVQELSCTALANAKVKGTVYQNNFFASSPYRECKSVFVFGKSSAGKSTVIQALSILLNIIKTGNIPPLTMYYNDKNTPIELSIACSNQSKDFEYTIAIHPSGNVLYEQLYSNDKPILLYNNTQQSLIINGVKLSQKKFDKYITSKDTSMLHATRPILPKAHDQFLNCIKKIQVMPPYESTYTNRMSEKMMARWICHNSFILKWIHHVDSSICRMIWSPCFENGMDIMYQLLFEHRQTNGTFCYRPLSDECRSLKMLMHLIPYVINIHEGATVVIDDLHLYLNEHALIELLTNDIHTTHNKMAQIIATTHDISLLTTQLLSPHQIHFISGDTPNTILSLADYSRIPANPDIRTMYLQGSFGGYYETTSNEANPYS